MNNNMFLGMKHINSKRLKYFMATLVCLMTLCFVKADVLAAGESAALSGGGAVSEGDIVNVSLTVNCNAPVWGFDAVLSYDSSVLQFLSTSGGIVNGGNGQIEIAGLETQARSQTVTVAFKALEKGSSAVSLIQCLVSNGDSEVNCSGSAVSVAVNNSVPAPEPTPMPAPGDDISGDATLSSLTVSQGSLSPEFNPWIFWYELEVEEGTDSIVVSAKTTDPESEVIAVNGSKSIEHGENVVTVITESSGGASLTYTIVVYCGVHADGTAMDSVEDKAKEVDVTVGGGQYIISNKIPQEEVPSGYKKALASLNGQNILVVTNSKIGVSLALLKKDAEDAGAFFVLDEQSGTLYPYFRISLNDKKAIVLLQPEANAVVADGLKLNASEVLGKSFYCCQSDEENIYYFYAVDQDGNRSWYRYDDVDKTYQRCDMESKVKAGKELEDLKAELKSSQNTRLIFMIAAIVAGILFIIFLIVAIVFISKYRSGAAFYKDDDEEDDNEVTDDEEDENEVTDDEEDENEVTDDEEDENEVTDDEETEATEVETTQESEQSAGQTEEITVGSDEETVSYDTFHRGLDASLIEMELERTKKEKESNDDNNIEEVELDDDYNIEEVEPDDDYKTAEVEPDDDYARVSTRHKDKKEETDKVEFEFIDFDE